MEWKGINQICLCLITRPNWRQLPSAGWSEGNEAGDGVSGKPNQQVSPFALIHPTKGRARINGRINSFIWARDKRVECAFESKTRDKLLPPGSALGGEEAAHGNNGRRGANEQQQERMMGSGGSLAFAALDHPQSPIHSPILIQIWVAIGECSTDTLSMVAAGGRESSLELAKPWANLPCFRQCLRDDRPKQCAARRQMTARLFALLPGQWVGRFARGSLGEKRQCEKSQKRFVSPSLDHLHFTPAPPLLLALPLPKSAHFQRATFEVKKSL